MSTNAANLLPRLRFVNPNDAGRPGHVMRDEPRVTPARRGVRFALRGRELKFGGWTSLQRDRLNPLSALPTDLSAFLEPPSGTLADLPGNLFEFTENVACTFVNRLRRLADFNDGLSGSAAIPRELPVAMLDHESGIPARSTSHPFDVRLAAFHRNARTVSAGRRLGGGMTARVQHGQADGQPKQRTGSKAHGLRGKARNTSHVAAVRSSAGSSTAASSDHVSHTSWPAPLIRSRDFARFGSATETGSARPSRYT